MAIRTHADWNGWLRFFLRGVVETAQEATETAGKIVALGEDHRAILQQSDRPANGLRFLDLLFEQPLVDAAVLKERLGLSLPTVYRLLEQFERLGLIAEITGGERYRVFLYAPYLALFAEPESGAVDAGDAQTSEAIGHG